jgi:DsbC/DsbD-like thiol-disulfide interchange protein
MRIFVFLSFFFHALPAAYAGNLGSEVVSHQVLTGWVDKQGRRIAALELRLAPGWKTYWRIPGDAGIPTQLRLAATKNLQDMRIKWPAPILFWEAGARSIGYKDTLVLPLYITPNQPGRPIELRGEVSLGVCSDICVPLDLPLNVSLPPNVNEKHPSILAALTALPFSGAEAGLGEAKCELSPSEQGLTLRATLALPSTGRQEEAVIEAGAPDLWVSVPQVQRRGGQLTLTSQIIPQSDAPLVVDRSKIAFLILGSKHAVRFIGCTG